MISVHPASASLNAGAVWVDLLDPSDAERAEVGRATGLQAPSRAALSEIESSSRLRYEDGVLTLSTPFWTQTETGHAILTPVGFVLSRSLLVTVRFARLSAFDAVGATCDASAKLGAEETFLRLLEAVVDQSADRLEEAAVELENISHRTFLSNGQDWTRRGDFNRSQRKALNQVGEMGGRISKLRDSLLGLGRIAAFITEAAGHQLDPASHGRLQAVRSDLSSLSDYQAHLHDKVQFLLDATLGFINIQQNEIVKALTIASVVGIPPVLVAGIYGMNFKNMPEYAWSWGYPYSLILMLVSGLLPLAWFKWRGWM